MLDRIQQGDVARKHHVQLRGPDGELRLWSCKTASGDAGEAFIEALSKAVGADVCASP